MGDREGVDLLRRGLLSFGYCGSCMIPEVFADRLHEALGDCLACIALYGSAASGDRSECYSDFNTLVVCRQLGVRELRTIRPLSRDWFEAGNPPPLLFTWERLIESSGVFPIELLDIKENHVLLFGEDILKRLPIRQENLRFQLEHELKGKLIQLRESYLVSGDSLEEQLEMMVRSLSSFQVLLRGCLRFFEVSVPVRKRDAVIRLEKHFSFDLAAFHRLQEIKDGGGWTELEVELLFQGYLDAIERTADLVNRLGVDKG